VQHWDCYGCFDCFQTYYT